MAAEGSTSEPPSTADLLAAITKSAAENKMEIGGIREAVSTYTVTANERFAELMTDIAKNREDSTRLHQRLDELEAQLKNAEHHRIVQDAALAGAGGSGAPPSPHPTQPGNSNTHPQPGTESPGQDRSAPNPPRYQMGLSAQTQALVDRALLRGPTNQPNAPPLEPHAYRGADGSVVPPLTLSLNLRSPNGPSNAAMQTDLQSVSLGYAGSSKRPCPKPLTEDMIRDYMSRDNAKQMLRLHLENLLLHESECGRGTLNLNQMRRYFEGPPLTWVDQFLKSGILSTERLHPCNEPDAATFVFEFLRYCGVEVRQEDDLALEKLLNKGVAQKQGELAAQYVQRFKVVARLAAGPAWGSQFTQRMLCSKLIDGMLPDLRKKCITDESGRDWSDLEKLIAFAYTAERRLKAKQTASTPSRKQGQAATIVKPMNASTPPHVSDDGAGLMELDAGFTLVTHSRGRNNQGNKQRRSSSAPPRGRPNRLATHRPMTTSEMPYANKTDTTWADVELMPNGKYVKHINTKEGYEKALRELAFDLKPAHKFPYLGFRGNAGQLKSPNTLTETEAAELSFKLDLCSAWWICGHCHKDRHAWEECPDRRGDKRPISESGGSQQHKKAK